MSRGAAGAGTARRGGGVMTEYWGWQPTARLVAGLPAWSWRSAPRGLLTRRQIREAGLAPGGADPVGLVVCRRGRRWAYLWRQEDLVAKRVSSPAQLAALDRAGRAPVVPVVPPRCRVLHPPLTGAVRGLR